MLAHNMGIMKAWLNLYIWSQSDLIWDHSCSCRHTLHWAHITVEMDDICNICSLWTGWFHARLCSIFSQVESLTLLLWYRTHSYHDSNHLLYVPQSFYTCSVRLTSCDSKPLFTSSLLFLFFFLLLQQRFDLTILTSVMIRPHCATSSCQTSNEWLMFREFL